MALRAQVILLAKLHDLAGTAIGSLASSHRCLEAVLVALEQDISELTSFRRRFTTTTTHFSPGAASGCRSSIANIFSQRRLRTGSAL